MSEIIKIHYKDNQDFATKSIQVIKNVYEELRADDAELLVYEINDQIKEDVWTIRFYANLPRILIRSIELEAIKCEN